MARGDLTDEKYEQIASWLPPCVVVKGSSLRPHRQVLNGILWILRTGAPRRDLPVSYGAYQTCYDRLEPISLGQMVVELQPFPIPNGIGSYGMEATGYALNHHSIAADHTCNFGRPRCLVARSTFNQKAQQILLG